MAVGRQLNIQGQWRLDVPHIRSIESAVAYDFDVLAGAILGGRNAYIVNGFVISGATIAGLSMAVANSTVIHYNASYNGSVLMVPSGRPAETAWNASIGATGTYYVGLDYVRAPDSTTTDTVQFLNVSVNPPVEVAVATPLAQTLNYSIIVSTNNFTTQGSTVCPIAIITTSGGTLTSVVDARRMYLRLNQGGDVATSPAAPFTWGSRAAEVTTSFTGGDKVFTHERDWKSGIMSRLWEITGGEYWYSDVTDRNLKFYGDVAAPLTVATTTLTWTGLHIALDNSTYTVNDITNGSHNFAVDGDLAYVEINRGPTGSTTLAVQYSTAATYGALAAPTRPGSRYIIFWRKGSYIYSRLDYTPVGVYSGSATRASYGVVKTNTDEGVSGGPFVPSMDSATVASANVVAAGITRGSIGSGALTIGGGANDAAVYIGGTATTIGLGNAIAGVHAIGIGGSTSATETINIGCAIGGTAAQTLNISTAITSGLASNITIGTALKVAGSFYGLWSFYGNSAGGNGLVTWGGAHVSNNGGYGLVSYGGQGASGFVGGPGVFGTGGTSLGGVGGTGLVGVAGTSTGAGGGIGVQGTGSAGSGYSGWGSSGAGVFGLTGGAGPGVSADGSTTNVGLDARGNPAVRCTPNGTRAPLNIVPNAPSVFANGDIWIDSGDGRLKARLSGATNGFDGWQYMEVLSANSAPATTWSGTGTSVAAGTYEYEIKMYYAKATTAGLAGVGLVLTPNTWTVANIWAKSASGETLSITQPNVGITDSAVTTLQTIRIEGYITCGAVLIQPSIQTSSGNLVMYAGSSFKIRKIA